jgi:hypothetical protein
VHLELAAVRLDERGERGLVSRASGGDRTRLELALRLTHLGTMTRA